MLLNSPAFRFQPRSVKRYQNRHKICLLHQRLTVLHHKSKLENGRTEKDAIIAPLMKTRSSRIVGFEHSSWKKAYVNDKKQKHEMRRWLKVKRIQREGNTSAGLATVQQSEWLYIAFRAHPAINSQSTQTR